MTATDVPRTDLRRARMLRAAPAYVAAVAAVQVVTCLGAGAASRAALVEAASTNVVNLMHGRFATVLTSAFVLEGRACLPALLVLGGVLAVAELAWGALVVAAVFVYGHVAATLLVFAGLAAGLSLHRLCEGIASAPDVGPSYGGVAVLGALLATLPRARRRPAVAVALVVATTVVLAERAFTDVGHLLALLIGIGLGTVIARVRPARAVASGPA